MIKKILSKIDALFIIWMFITWQFIDILQMECALLSIIIWVLLDLRNKLSFLSIKRSPNSGLMSIAMLIIFFLGVLIVTIMHEDPKPSEIEYFKTMETHEQMKNYSWMIVESDPDQEWKIRNRGLKIKKDIIL